MAAPAAAAIAAAEMANRENVNDNESNVCLEGFFAIKGALLAAY